MKRPLRNLPFDKAANGKQTETTRKACFSLHPKRVEAFSNQGSIFSRPIL